MGQCGMTRKNFPQRGDVFWVRLDPTIGSEVNKTRPAVVISNNAGNEMSPRVIVAPITSSASKIYPFEAKVNLAGKKGKVLLDQIRTLDKSRLKDKIDILPTSTMQEIDKALKISLALS